jgi:GTP-binding protein
VGSSAFVASFPTTDFHLPQPLPEIAFLGRSNVGKSSLLNRLAGRHGLAHTSRTPGKTALLNVFAIDGRYYYVDLPGYGYARRSHTERRTLARLVTSYLERGRAAGVIWLLDIRRDPSPEDVAMGALLADHGLATRVAFTKVDTIPRGRRAERARDIVRRLAVDGASDPCLTSARLGEGIGQLRSAIERLVERARKLEHG